MKVALYGNVCNNFYVLAKSLRNNNIADAHLYLHDKVDIQNKPESDDPHLKDNYPDWIHMDARWNPFHFLKKFDKTFVKELNQYDVVFLSDLGVLLAPYIKAKTIFYTTGMDLTRIPFPKRYFEGVNGMKVWFTKHYISYMQRRGIKRVDKIITQPFYPFQNALNDLSIPRNKISNSYYPILVDTNNIKAVDNAFEKIDSVNKEKLAPFKFILFHPSRLFIQRIPSHIATGHWKGNDNLIEAFAIFIKKYNIADACLAMPERIHSPDISLAKNIISEMGIQENVVWLKPTSKEGFPRNELINFYSVADIIADEFATGWFGSIVIEGAACSKPTFCYVEETVMKQLYPWHPIISARDPQEVAELIAKYYFDEALTKETGRQSRRWAEQFHSLEEGAKTYSNNLIKDLSSIIS